MSDDASQRLDELKLLWESDPSSKVYLQLASAYRQSGQIDKAIEVLETSLQHRPRDPRGRVALSRCNMEKGDFAAAAELLEEVIRQDAAHVEANKQLLECYLRLGDAEKAEERLGIYKLLNDRDPELDHLEYRLQSLQGGESEPTQDAAATTREVFVEPPASAAPAEPQPVAAAPVPPVVETPPAPAPPLAEEVADEAESGDDATSEDDAESGDDATSEDEHRPIPGLPAMKFAVAGSEEETAESSPAGSSPAGSQPVEPVGVPPSIPEPSLESAAASEPQAIVVEPAEAPVADVPVAAEPVSEEPSAQESPQPTVAPPAGDELFDLAPEPAAEPADEAEFDPWGGDDLFDLAPPPAVGHEAADELDGLWEQTEVVDIEDDDETDVSEAADGEEEIFVAAEPSEDAARAEEEAEAEPAPVEAEDKATATLGLLYLRQGHLDEAEKIFRRVLDTDADNEAALAGLQQLELQRVAKHEADAEAAVTASETAAETAAEPPAPEPSEPEPEPEQQQEAAEPEAPEPRAQPELEPESVTSGLTADVLLGRQALEGGVPDDVTGRKIAVLQQYIQHIRTASRDHVH